VIERGDQRRRGKHERPGCAASDDGDPEQTRDLVALQARRLDDRLANAEIEDQPGDRDQRVDHRVDAVIDRLQQTRQDDQRADLKWDLEQLGDTDGERAIDRVGLHRPCSRFEYRVATAHAGSV
jgi:hypothetical protein